MNLRPYESRGLSNQGLRIDFFSSLHLIAIKWWKEKSINPWSEASWLGTWRSQQSSIGAQRPQLKKGILLPRLLAQIKENERESAHAFILFQFLLSQHVAVARSIIWKRWIRWWRSIHFISTDRQSTLDSSPKWSFFNVGTY